MNLASVTLKMLPFKIHQFLIILIILLHISFINIIVNRRRVVYNATESIVIEENRYFIGKQFTEWLS